MEEILKMLEDYETKHNHYILSIRIYSDGSGYIITVMDNIIKNFNNLTELKEILLS